MDSGKGSGNENGLKRLVALLTVLVFLLVGWILLDKLGLLDRFAQPSQAEFVESAQVKLDSVAKQLNLRLVQIKKLGGRVVELEKARAQILGDQQHLGDINPEEFQKKLTYYLHPVSYTHLRAHETN
jgi:hypothetical protein